MSLRTLGGQILLGPGGPLDCDDPCCGGTGPTGLCHYMPDCSQVVVDPDGEGGTYSIPVNVEDACPWHAETIDSWIHIQPPISHLSAGFVNFTVDGNPDLVNGRVGRIQIINTLTGSGVQLCIAGFTPGVLIDQGPGTPASCATTVPSSLFVSGGPNTVNANGNPVFTGFANPWGGFLTNIGFACSWVDVDPVGSWLGYEVTPGSPALGFAGGSRPPGAWWFVIQNATSTGPNIWKKVYGSTPLGVYVACDEFGGPELLTVPQIITIS